MVHGGCNILIGRLILINSIFVKYSQKLGNNIQFQGNGEVKLWEEYVLLRCKWIMYLNMYKLTQMRNGLIIHNID